MGNVIPVVRARPSIVTVQAAFAQKITIRPAHSPASVLLAKLEATPLEVLVGCAFLSYPGEELKGYTNSASRQLHHVPDRDHTQQCEYRLRVRRRVLQRGFRSYRLRAVSCWGRFSRR